MGYSMDHWHEVISGAREFSSRMDNNSTIVTFKDDGRLGQKLNITNQVKMQLQFASGTWNFISYLALCGDRKNVEDAQCNVPIQQLVVK